MHPKGLKMRRFKLFDDLGWKWAGNPSYKPSIWKGFDIVIQENETTWPSTCDLPTLRRAS